MSEIYFFDDEIYKAKSGILVKTKKVFMERGIYPRWNEKKENE